MARVPIDKTYKLFIKGEFVRSESGRSLTVADLSRQSTTQIAHASRKDVREAVNAAKAGESVWAQKTAYLRGQILYRLAEMMESRQHELIQSRVNAGASHDYAQREVELSIDRVVHYAGWSDKFQSLLSTFNPVAGPHYNVTSPEALGVVAVFSPNFSIPNAPSLLSMVSTVLPIIVSGNAAVVFAPDIDPRTAIIWCECIAASDMPPGVINMLTGIYSELLKPIAQHMNVQGLDLWRSESFNDALAQQAAEWAAENVKRTRIRTSTEPDWSTAQGLSWIEPWVELKTIWHPVGL